jgi:ubiquinone biosynthesis accessory factor UbiJ
MFYTLLEKQLNLACSLNLYHTRSLRLLAGKVIVFELTHPTLTFCLHFSTTRITLQSTPPPVSDLILRGTLLQFLKLQCLPTGTALEALSVTGDFALLGSLNPLFTPSNIDWEELLSKLFGDFIAHHLCQFLRERKKQQAHLAKTCQLNIQEYLQEEICLLPTLPEANHFYQEVDTLRDDVERLASKITHLCLQSPSSKRHD